LMHGPTPHSRAFPYPLSRRRLLRKLTLTIAAAVLVGCSGQVSTQEALPITPVQPTVPTTTAPQPTTTLPPTTTVAPTTTTTTTLVPPGSKCEELAPIAYAAGWPQELLVDVLDEAWSESRCQNVIKGHPQWNGSDSGPMQINEVWNDEIEAKYGDWHYVNDPYYNFAWAWEMYIWFDAHKGCGFIPWTRKCN
jgi:hypothetical protein